MDRLDDLDDIIGDLILKKKEELKNQYSTIDEIQENGIDLVFGGEDEKISLNTAFNSGRSIGETEGYLDALQNIYNIINTWMMNDLED